MSALETRAPACICASWSHSGTRRRPVGSFRALASSYCQKPEPVDTLKRCGGGRKRLKELYKELTSLEVEESSFRKH